jgi:uncharacterized protein YbjT (DUF2867 family)
VASDSARNLPLRVRPDGSPARVLVTGSTGYIGGRLVPVLLGHGYTVRVIVRNSSRLRFHPWGSQVEIVDGDAGNPVDVRRAMKDVDVAFYLLHALNAPRDFEEEERRLATTFAEAAKASGVSRVIYLGGMVDDETELSAHLSSRMESGEILRANGVSTIELRAGIVIGSGSASFEMLRYLTERLPIMTTPRWVNTLTQPIAVRDVLRYLVGAVALPDSVEGVFDIGGPDVLSYRAMMDTYAKVAGLRPRIIIPIPVLTPRLSSGWVGLVTPVPYQLARRLVASLKNEVIAHDSRIRDLIPDPEGGLTSCAGAITLALARIKEAHVDTRWSDASIPGAPSDPLPTDPDWAGGSIYTDVRTAMSNDSIETVWARVEAVGGDNGYSRGSWAWEIRGLIDRVFGGVGLRRGRRDPLHLVEGEALDFWRVETLQPPRVLRLRAEMKMPGLAWLEFVVDEHEGQTRLTQRAIFAPRGLAGHFYWWAVWPMHGFVFPSMVHSLATGEQ